jgi:hypothetical protein
MSSGRIEHPNLALLRRVAERLGELREEVVFLGGASTSLLITDPAARPVRATVGVDVVIEVASRSAYRHIQRQLRQAGFEEDERPGAPLCRWVVDQIPVDVMPTDASILGFTNRWYPRVVAAPTLSALSVQFAGNDDFPLQGGAVEPFLDRRAAVFVYKRRHHTASLFVVQSDGLAFPTSLRAGTVRGFSVAFWMAGGQGYALVSDLNLRELLELQAEIASP